MELEEKAEELLETIWIGTEERKEKAISPDAPGAGDEGTIEQLLAAGYVTLEDGKLRLTGQGWPVARSVVRRHRLAERLLADVLGTSGNLVHDKACKFEHLLDRGLDESVCSLLGHPKICPHGKPIPEGGCCRRGTAPASALVSPLSRMEPGQKGRVAYVHAPELGHLQKLMAMGILPGAPVTLIQSFPSYVFKMGETQFAVDGEIAGAIYVRLVQDEAIHEAGKGPAAEKRQRKRRRWRWWSKSR